MGDDERVPLSREGLLQLEHEGWASLCEGSGAGFYGDLMTADGVMVLINGMIMSRPEVIASLDGAPTWDSYSLDYVQRIGLGEGAAALVYRATASRAASDDLVAAMSSIYRLVDGRPRLAVYQQTGVPTA